MFTERQSQMIAFLSGVDCWVLTSLFHKVTWLVSLGLYPITDLAMIKG